ncbi:MAG: general secretion pathway protein GspK [Kiritimatiellae bacterium]|nr:general secretion pathway protein GspK [Kiritimatiellia bacterium]
MPCRPSAGWRRAARHGSALVLVLSVFGAVLVLLGAALTEARGRAALAAARLERERLRALAAAELEQALQRLADDDDLLCDHADELWARPNRRRTPDGDAIETVIEDEQQRWDLNNLSAEPSPQPRRPAEDIATDLFRLAGDPDPADRILALRDWMDADREGAREAPHYAELVPRRVPPNRPLESWAELQWIAGFPDDWLRDPSLGAIPADRRLPLRDLVTLIPGPHRRVTPVNLNSAPEPLLAVLFGRGQQHLPRAVIALRSAAPLRSIEGLVVLADPLRMVRLLPYLDVKSEWFRVRIRIRGSRQALSEQALVRRGPDGRVRVVRWSGE